MAKGKNKPTAKQQIQIDRYARVLQMVAIISLVALYAIDSFNKDFEVPVWAYFGIMGVGVGLSPEQIIGILKDFLRGRRA